MRDERHALHLSKGHIVTVIRGTSRSRREAEHFRSRNIVGSLSDEIFRYIEMFEREGKFNMSLIYMGPQHIQKLGSPEQRGCPFRILLPNGKGLSGELSFDRKVADQRRISDDHRGPSHLKSD